MKSSLRFWAIAFRVSLAALTALLLILRCFTHADFPLDGRNLLDTPKHNLIFEIGRGQYYHFELRKALQGILRDHKRRGKQTEHVKLLVNIDGLPIFKSTGKGLWLILCSDINGKKYILSELFWE